MVTTKPALFYVEELAQCRILTAPVEALLTKHGYSTFFTSAMATSETFASPPVLKLLFSYCDPEFHKLLCSLSRIEIWPEFYRNVNVLNKPYQWTNAEEWKKTGFDARFLAQAEKFGFRTGIVFPTYGPGGSRYIVRIAGDRDPACNHEISDLHDGILEIFGFFLNLSRQDNICDGLSVRETEIIRWSAYGKTSEEIAIILGISKFTVERHLKASCAKLDSANKVELVYKATKYGII
jgi:DNA-binding CsgD family transcriptional regulator